MKYEGRCCAESITISCFIGGEYVSAVKDEVLRNGGSYADRDIKLAETDIKWRAGFRIWSLNKRRGVTGYGGAGSKHQ